MHILWLLMGFLGALWIFWDTRKQGYSFESSFRWALGTFFVPAAVIPFYLFQSNVRQKSHKRHNKGPLDITANMLLKCPCCGNFYEGNPERCPHCNALVKDE